MKFFSAPRSPHLTIKGARIVIAETADRVVVQYKGRKMEEADVLSLFESPKSNYTRALLAALPDNAVGDRLPTVSDMLFEPAPSGAGA